MRRITTAAVAAVALVLGGLGVLPAQAATSTQGTVTVKVTAPGGAPIDGVSIAISPAEGWDYDYGTTSAAGTYKSGNLTPGTYSIKAELYWPTGVAPVTKSVTISAGWDSSITIALSGIQSLSGKVTQNGKALAKGDVTITSAAGDYYSAPVNNGTYSALVLPGKTYDVYVRAPWPATSYLTTYAGSTVREIDAKKIAVSATAGARADIALYTKLGKITGVVRDSKGKPVAGASVSVNATNRTAYGSATSAANGTYTIQGLPAGRYEVGAYKGSSTSYNAAKAKSYTVRAGATTKTSVSIKGAPKGAITLKVKASKTVWKRAGGVCATATTTKGGWGGQACATSKTKKLTIKGLAGGTYKVTLDGTNQSYKVVVKSSKTTTKTVTRPTGTSISGTARSSSNKILAGAHVQIVDGNGTSLGSTMTSSKGRYTVPGAVKGTYRVHVSPAKPTSGAPTAKKLTVKKGKKATANVRLTKGAVISGKITTTSGKGIAGMYVDVFGAGWGSAVTNSKGEYKVYGLVKGTYKVSAIDPNVGGYYNTKATTVKVSTGKAKKAKTLKATAG